MSTVEELTEQVATQQKQIDQLVARLAETQPSVPPQGVPSSPQRRVTVSSPVSDDCDLPNEAELDRLIALVIDRHEVLHPRAGVDDSFRRQVLDALRWLAFARRSTKPEPAYYYSFWLDKCRRSVKERDCLADVSLMAFVIGIIAAGVPYEPVHRLPHDLTFGLLQGDAQTPTAGWRDVLALGVCPNPRPPLHQPAW
jgi:hypothetical protein